MKERNISGFIKSVFKFLFRIFNVIFDKFRKWTKSNKRIILTIFILFFAVILSTDYIIDYSTKYLVYDDLTKIPHNKVGIILGTSKFLGSGLHNQYFTNRIKAAVVLFKAQKIDYIVVSGDNRRKNYNEPFDMKNELLKSGIPDSVIFLDYAGFRTYDSVIRLNRIFGQKSFTIISQKFHNQRAVFIAEHLGLHAVGYNAEDVFSYQGFKTKLREKFARVKVFIDFLIDKKPKFLGKKIEIK
jgi:SanA protein